VRDKERGTKKDIKRERRKRERERLRDR